MNWTVRNLITDTPIVSEVTMPFVVGEAFVLLPKKGEYEIFATDIEDEYTVGFISASTLELTDTLRRRAEADASKDSTQKIKLYEKLLSNPDLSHTTRASTHHALGLIHRSLGQVDFKSSIRHLSAAGEIYQQQNSPAFRRTQFDLSTAFNLDGDDSTALSILESLTSTDLSSDLNFDVLNETALIYLYRGELQRAAEYLTRARHATDPSNHVQRGIILNNIGGLALRSGRYTDAAEAFAESLSAYRKTGHLDRQIGALTNSSTAYRNLGNYALAMNLLSEALDLSPQEGYDKAAVLLDFGRLHMETEQWNRSLNYLDAAATEIKKTGDRRAEASIDLDRAKIAVRTGKLDRSIEQMLVSATEAEINLHLSARAHCDLAHFYLSVENLSAWENHQPIFSEIAKQATAEGITGAQACLDHVAGVWLKKSKNFNAAKTRLESALASATQNSTPLLQIESLLVLAENAMEANDLHASKQHLNDIKATLDKFENNYQAGLSRKQFMESWRSMIDLRLAVEYKQDGQPPFLNGLKTSWKSKHTSYQHSLAHRAATPTTRTRKEINSILLKNAISQADGLGNDNAERMLELAHIESRLEDTTAGELSKERTIAFTQNQLAADDAILFLHTGKYFTFVWLVTQNKIDFHVAPGLTRLGSVVEQLNQAIVAQASNTLVESLSLELSQALIQPFEAQLGAKNIYIVSDRKFHLLPFSLLPLSNHEILAESNRIAYLSYPGPPSTQLRTAGSVSIVGTNLDDRELNVIEEIAHSISLESNQLVTDFEDLHDLQTLLADHSPITHISAHAYAHPSDASISALTLNADPFISIASGNTMTALIIAGSVVNKELVVLSACETGTYTGLGFEQNNLAGAFLQAGAGSVIATLWRVPSFAAEEFSKQFYKSLLVDKTTPLQALNATQKQMRSSRRFSHPFFWTGFQLSTKAL